MKIDQKENISNTMRTDFMPSAKQIAWRKKFARMSKAGKFRKATRKKSKTTSNKDARIKKLEEELHRLEKLGSRYTTKDLDRYMKVDVMLKKLKDPNWQKPRGWKERYQKFGL